ncbi:hypothetical protein, partial [Leptospira borgpetersenii]|uniref:hypothetical protein n=1 Tax=Leptospira borgpetersenii TaxID=174 RepID=UPI001D141A47
SVFPDWLYPSLGFAKFRFVTRLAYVSLAPSPSDLRNVDNHLSLSDSGKFKSLYEFLLIKAKEGEE